MKNNLKLFISVLAIVPAIIAACLAVSLSQVDKNADEEETVIQPQPLRPIIRKITDLMRERTPPVVQVFNITPGNPGPRDKVLVSLGVVPGKAQMTGVTLAKKLKKKDQDKMGFYPGVADEDQPQQAKEKTPTIKFLKLFFTNSAGKKWGVSDAAPAVKNAANRNASLPAFPGGSSVTLSLFSEDSSGRTLIEAGCTQKKWPPPLPLLDKNCIFLNGGDLEDCVRKTLPVNCMFPIAGDAPPRDDPPTMAGDDLDIIAASAGYDDKNIYLSMSVQRMISSGSITPIKLNQYGFIIMDPTKAEAASEERIPHGGVIVKYFPFGLKSKDFVVPCGVLRHDNSGNYLDDKSVTCKADGPFLHVKLYRDTIKKGKIKDLIIMAYTGVARGEKLDEFSIADFTMPTMFSLGGRSYSVRK